MAHHQNVTTTAHLHYNKNTLYGYQEFGNMQLPVRVENIGDEKRILKYLEVMRDLAKKSNPYILKYKGVYVDKGLVTTEMYTHTMTEVMRRIGNRWWEASSGSSNCRMSPELQKLIKKVMQGIKSLTSVQASFWITLDSIVFYYENSIVSPDDDSAFTDDAIPKIRNIWDVEEEYNPQNLWSGLAESIDNMIKFLDVSVENEVKSFLEMLKTNGECLDVALMDGRSIRQKIIHPALLTRKERLDFIENIRNFFHEGKSFYFLMNDGQRVCIDWQKKVTQDRHLEIAYNNKGEVEKTAARHGYPDPKGLIFFIGECIEHVRDRLWRDDAGELTMDELDEKFDKLFPNFYTYVYDSYASVYANLLQHLA